MKALLLKLSSLSLLLCLFGCASQSQAAAQFVDLRAQIEFYTWSTAPPAIVNVHCVVGTNSWQIDGEFCRNCDPTYWFTGTNIIEHSIVAKVIPGASPLGAEVDHVFESFDGNPGTLSACGPNGQRLDVGPDRLCPLGRIAWLAFCSGPCLKRPGRLIFPPSDLWKELICAPSGFSDRTVVYDDALGLPKSINLYTPRTERVLQYRVIDSTNILGWRFPLEFNMAQYRPAPLPESPSITFGTNGWELEFTAKGRVIAIGVGTAPQIPAKFANTRDKATLNPEQAGSLAQQLANERAQTLYNCQPFYKAQPARLADGHWSWHQLQAQAKGDMEAKVEFKANGAEPNVSVMRLKSLPDIP